MSLVLDIITWITLIQLGILITVIFSRREKTKTAWFLAFFFVTNIVLVGFFNAIKHDLFQVSVYTYYLVWSCYFLLGPLLYFYFKSMLPPTPNTRDALWPHLIAMPLSVVLCWIAYAWRSKGGQLDVGWFGLPGIINAVAMEVWIAAYIVAIFRMFAKLSHGSSTGKPYTGVNLTWLMAITVVFVVHWLFDVARLTLFFMADVPASVHQLLGIFAIGIFGIFAIAAVISGLQKNASLASNLLAGSQAPVEKAPRREERHLQLHQQLLAYMDQKQPFLDPELTLEELATGLGAAPKLVSRCLNESIGKNFFDFVNGYRLEKAKALLSSNQHHHMNISEILFESGFNSKASFNRIFKKHLNQTPSEFRSTIASQMAPSSFRAKSQTV